MSNQNNQPKVPLHDQPDEPMLLDYREEEQIQPGYIGVDEQDLEFDQGNQDSDTDNCTESEQEFDSKQRRRELAHRSRVSSFSSGKSASSAPGSNTFGNKRGIDKDPRFRSPYLSRGSSGSKRDRSSNSSEEGAVKQSLKLKKSSLDKVVDILSAVGGQDKRKPPPPAKIAPAGNPKQTKPKSQLLPPSTPSGNKRQDMAGKAVSDRSNTDEFSVVEQNSEKVNINDISRNPEIAAVVLELSRGDGLKTLQAFISAGKKFSGAILRSRASGKKFIRTMGLIINIQTDSDQITHTDLTKQRMMKG